MQAKDYVGKTVKFLPGPRSTEKVTAKVTAAEKKGNFDFLVTKDDAGKERRVQPGRCIIV